MEYPFIFKRIQFCKRLTSASIDKSQRQALKIVGLDECNPYCARARNENKPFVLVPNGKTIIIAI